MFTFTNPTTNTNNPNTTTTNTDTTTINNTNTNDSISYSYTHHHRTHPSNNSLFQYQPSYHKSLKQQNDYATNLEIRRQNSLLIHKEKRHEYIGKRRRSLHLDQSSIHMINTPTTVITLDEINKKLTKEELQSLIQSLFASQLNGQSVNERLPLLKRLRQYVSSSEIEECEGIIGYAVDHGVVDLLVSELSGRIYDLNTKSEKGIEVGIANQSEALWSLTNLASITGAHTEAILQSMPYAIALINDHKNELSEHAAWLIGNMAAEDENVRKQLIAQGAFHALVNIYSKDYSPSSTSTPIRTAIDSSIIPPNVSANAMHANIHHSSFLTTPTSPSSSTISISPTITSPQHLIQMQLLRTVSWALSNLLRGNHHHPQSPLHPLINTTPFTAMIKVALHYVNGEDETLAIESSWILVGCTHITALTEEIFELGLSGSLLTRIQHLIGVSDLDNNKNLTNDEMSQISKKCSQAAMLPLFRILANITTGADAYTATLLSTPNSLPCNTLLFMLKIGVLSEQQNVKRESIIVLASLSSTLHAEYVPSVLSLFPLQFWFELLLHSSPDILHETAWLLYAFARFQSMSSNNSNDFSLFNLDEQHVRPLLKVYVDNLRRPEFDYVRVSLRMLTLVMQRSRIYVEILQELGVIDALESLPLYENEHWATLRQEAKGLVDKYWGIDEEMLNTVPTESVHSMEDIPVWRREAQRQAEQLLQQQQRL